MSYSDPYNAYVEGNIYSSNRLELVLAMYEGTIDSIARARACLASGDIWGRSKAINKAVDIVTELLVSLDHKEGGEISANLKRLYSYIQCRLLEGHAQKTEQPMLESERLLSTMLEGWREAANKLKAEGHASGAVARQENSETGPTRDTNAGSHYGSFAEPAELAGSVTAVF